MAQFFDISLPLTNSMVVYPGMAPTSIKSVVSSSGTSVHSEVSFTTHTGTHADAPSHAIDGGASLDELPLDIFYGSCRVMDVTRCRQAVGIKDIEKYNIQKNERILLKTQNSLRGFREFYEDYVYLDGRAAEYLANVGVRLVGIDALSIKQRGSNDLRPHTALLSKNIPILEGLDLSRVPEGRYVLCAFPLAFRGLDGSPIRAIVIKN